MSELFPGGGVWSNEEQPQVGKITFITGEKINLRVLPSPTEPVKFTDGEQTKTVERNTDSMKKTKKSNKPKDKTKARGGLAADMAADADAGSVTAPEGVACGSIDLGIDEPKPAIKKKGKKKAVKASKSSKAPKAPKATSTARQGTLRTKGGLGSICGFAVTAVLRCLGSKGVTAKQAAHILKAKDINMPEKSLGVQVAYGRCGTRPPAPLTAEQVAELKALIPAEEETKSEEVQSVE